MGHPRAYNPGTWLLGVKVDSNEFDDMGVFDLRQNKGFSDELLRNVRSVGNKIHKSSVSPRTRFTSSILILSATRNILTATGMLLDTERPVEERRAFLTSPQEPCEV